MESGLPEGSFRRSLEISGTQFFASAGPPELQLLACFLAQVPFCLPACLGGPGLLFFDCLLELLAQVWRSPSVLYFQFAFLVVKFVVGHGLFFRNFDIKRLILYKI